MSLQTLAAIGPQTQTWPSATIQDLMTPSLPPKSVCPLLKHGPKTPPKPQAAAQILGLRVGPRENLGHRLHHRPQLKLNYIF